jgi:hypothetical protein
MLPLPLNSNKWPTSGLQHPASAPPQVVACLQLEERAAAGGLWPGDDFALLAAACVGQVQKVVVKVICTKGGLLCWTWQYSMSSVTCMPV